VSSREAWIVVDLGFGDAGKGACVDFLARSRGADLVVRFNGGAQAGHNVLTPDGRHHTFSQFGAASFVPGARALMGPDFLLHPGGMAVEAEHLARAMGAPAPWDRTAIDARARVITPYQQAAGRVRELLRGDAAHGTCGVGVGECVRDHLEHPADTIRASDLGDPPTLRRRLGRQRERLRAALAALPGPRGPAARRELAIFDDPGLIGRAVEAWGDVRAGMWVIGPAGAQRLLREAERVIFEGAQGILLDERWGFHPHTTWSDCTPRGALRMLAAAGAEDRRVVRLGVHRAACVRHGPGPFPTAGTLPAAEAHNEDGGWQGRFRAGALDAVLLRYALDASGGIDALAINHLDRAASPAQVCYAYDGEGHEDLVTRAPDGAIVGLRPGPAGALAWRSRLGRLLARVRPRLRRVGDLPAFFGQTCGRPILIEGWGPSASDRRWR